jgi:hypothetical protein
MIRYLIGLILIVIGIALGIAIRHYYMIPLEEKINIVDLTTLLITIFLALYIPAFLDRRIQDKRYEKEVIIRKIEMLQNSFKDVNKLVTECVQKNSTSQTNCHLIINCFTSISNELETVITLLDHCYKGKLIKEINEIKVFRRDYKNLVTGGKFQSKNFKYSALTKKEEEKLYNNIDKAICLLIFKVNGI